MATPIPTNRAPFTLPDVAYATNGTIARRTLSSHDVCNGVFSDSRAVTPGSIFVALKGETHDGHAFIDRALANGAAIVVVERGRAVEAANVVEVDDTLVAWGDLARDHLTRWRTDSVDGSIVAITGSAGKTTTKELTAALLGAIGPTHFTAGNLNNRIGVPAVIFALEAKHSYCVLEMGMSIPGEIDAITAIAKPDVSVIVNVGVAHAEGVGGRDGVMHEKGGVYRALGPDGVAVVNDDDEYVVRAAKLAGARHVETFGHSNSAHYRLLTRDGSRVVFAAAGREIAINLPIPGEAAAIDLAAALAAQEAASRERLSSAQIEEALAGVRLDGRMTVVTLGELLVLDDTYNANPASMRAALATLAEVAGARRRVVVLGEMKELGAVALEEHVALGDVLADAKVALAIGCGGMIDRTLERARELGVDVLPCKNTEEAASITKTRLAAGDALLVKGSRSTRTELVIEALRAV
jgi:UDP-N-acetylmuramoyl-tripeptide--D-alanyl-D-alanine ligase